MGGGTIPGDYFTVFGLLINHSGTSCIFPLLFRILVVSCTKFQYQQMCGAVSPCRPLHTPMHLRRVRVTSLVCHKSLCIKINGTVYTGCVVPPSRQCVKGCPKLYMCVQKMLTNSVWSLLNQGSLISVHFYCVAWSLGQFPCGSEL